MTHFYGIFLNRGVPEDRGGELVAAMGQAFGRETYAIHDTPPTGRLCVGFAVPEKLSGRVAMPDLILHRDGLTLFGNVRLYNGDAIGATGTGSDLSILHRFVRQGHGLAGLNGDFAFGAYDHAAQQITLVRDQIGNRILYYAQMAEGLVFSTRIHCLFEIGFDRADVDPKSLATCLAMWFPGAGETFHPSIRELKPAHRLNIRPDGTSVENRFWSLEPRPGLTFKRDDEWVEHIRETFVRAVTSRMRDAERPGIRLSGGLDSSAVAGVMCARNPEISVRGFAHIPGEPTPALADDDAPYLKAVKDKWPNLSVTRVASRHFDLLSGPQHWDDIAASPCLDPYQFAVDALAAAQMDEDVDVILTGEGGDDGLSGFPETLLVESLLSLKFGDAWAEFRRMRTSDGYSVRKIVRAYLLPPLIPPSVKNAYRSMAVRPWHSELALNGNYVRDRGFLEHLAANGFPYLVAAPRTMRQQMQQRFSPVLSPLVALGDRYAGQKGFQVRHPLHDIDLLQSVCSAPASMMLTPDQDRALIRRVARPFLPGKVRNRPGKAPFVPDYLQRFETIAPELESRFSEFKKSMLWNSVCDARKPLAFFEQFDGSVVEKSEFGHLMHHVLMPYYLGCFLQSRGL